MNETCTWMLSHIMIATNDMRLILKSGKPKRLMGLKVHHVGFKPVNSPHNYCLCNEEMDPTYKKGSIVGAER